MKKKITSLLLGILLILTAICSALPAVAASEVTTVYVCESGNIPSGVQMQYVFTDISAAANALSGEGIIYICGDASFPSSLEKDHPVTVKGYPGTNGRVTLNKSYSRITGDITFESITIKGAPKDESWLNSSVGTVTFGKSCTFELSDSYTLSGKTVNTGVYIGHNSTGIADSHYVLNSPNITYNMIAPIACYSSGSYSVTGDVTFDLNDGSFVYIFAGARNGNSGTNSYQKLYGDVTYNINGGEYNNIYFGNLSGGYVYGTAIFNFNGGSFTSSSKAVFGNSSAKILSNTVNSADYSYFGNLAAIFDADLLESNNSSVSSLNITENSTFSSIPCNNSMLILNHAENTAYLPKVSVTNVNYLVKTVEGCAIPVFSDSDEDGNAGELLGFDITADKEGFSPRVNGQYLTENSNGYYDIPESSDGQFVTVTFENDLAGKYFTASFGIPEEYDEISAEGNTSVTLPVCTAKKSGYSFAGWENDEGIFASGSKYLINKNTEFSAVWISDDDIDAAYVNGDDGSDDNSGVSPYAPFKTLAAAITKADSDDLRKIVIMSDISEPFSIPENENRLVITAKDGDTNYGGSLTITRASKTGRPLTFEHMGLACKTYQFICTDSNHVIFGEGLVPVGELGISAHFGNEYSYAESVNVEIKSGLFSSIILGGGYLTTPMAGIRGDARLSVSDTNDLPLVVGFDSYTGYDSLGSIDGSVEIILDNSTLAPVGERNLSGISGAFYIIGYGSSVLPLAESLPDSDNGSYCIKVISDGTVRAATDENGDIIPGYINAVCDSAEKAVRITNSSGSEMIYDQGDINLSPGDYNLEFIEKGSLESVSFTVSAPIAGHPAKKVYFSTDKYYAIGEWFCGDESIDRFEYQKAYTLKLFVSPHQAIDTDNFTSATVNGNSASVTADDDGSYSVEYTFPIISSNYVKYVSESKGNDSNTGSASAPYATLNKAMTALRNTGGVVYICDAVNAAGTLPSNKKPILITGDGYADAKLYLVNNAGSFIKGEVIVENLSLDMGLYSHFNDTGYKLVFADSVKTLTASVMHAGPFASASVNSVDITLGKNTNFTSITLGGSYHNSVPTIKGDINITLRGSASALVDGSDSYLSSHVNAKLNGNVLITVEDSANLKKVSQNAHPLTVSDSTVYQFIFNNGAKSYGEFDSNIINSSKLYTVYSGIGGRVEHAKDDSGKSISGSFDILPDKNNVAIIKYGNTMALSSGGRYNFPAGTDIHISYINSEYPIEKFKVELNGGIENGNLFEIDENGCIHFIDAPVKKNHLFEGWYSDEALTKLITTGDFVGGNISLYAKYFALSQDVEDEIFAIRGVQIRVPNAESSLQGLRFITVTDNNRFAKIAGFSDKNSDLLRPVSGYDSCYGSVVMPTDILGANELVLDGEYEVASKTYRARSAKGINIFSSDDEKLEYTVCLLNITPDRYEYEYTVRSYITYYTRSGNLTTFYGEPYTIDVMRTTFAALESGTESDETEEYLRQTVIPLYAENRGIELLPVEVLEYVNDKTELYKQNVLDSEDMDLSGVTGKIYYVSPDGNDSNNGRSPSSPWKSIAKVNSTVLSSGDAVLFERGGEYRGKITATAGVTYAAYGSGAKPIINGSARDYADPSLWTETDIENVYRLNTLVKNVGLVALDHSKVIGTYNERVGTMRVSGVIYDSELFTNQYDLDDDLEFYCNMSTNTLYFYSDNGNPGERFDSIELATGGNLIAVSSRKHVTVDNLDLRYGGSHGVGGSGGLANYDSSGNLTSIEGCADLTVTNCLFSWIGGSILSDTTRFGNAVEIFGSVDGYLVQNNWIYQIYDTGVTHQISGSSVGNTHMRDILYKDNLIEYCHWSIEFYNQNCECCAGLATPIHSRIVEDVLCEGNIVRMGGYGWGSRIRPDGSTLYNSFGLSRVASETRNFHAKDNIFFRCAGGMYRIYANASEDNLTFESNLWIQDYGKTLAWYKNGSYKFDENAENYITSAHLKEENTRGVYFYAP